MKKLKDIESIQNPWKNVKYKSQITVYHLPVLLLLLLLQSGSECEYFMCNLDQSRQEIKRDKKVYNMLYNVCFCSMNRKHIQSKDLKASEANIQESFRAVGQRK